MSVYMLYAEMLPSMLHLDQLDGFTVVQAFWSAWWRNLVQILGVKILWKLRMNSRGLRWTYFEELARGTEHQWEG